MNQNIINQIISDIHSIQKDQIVISIDGRCASGKTTLADYLSKQLDANLFHMDDYFLRVEQRTKERYEEAGGNVDRERFMDEIGSKLHAKDDIVYQPFDCKTFTLKEKRVIKQTKITIVEGSYSMHAYLRNLYDYSIYLTIDPTLQLERIKKRNPNKVDVFIEKWIPLEEKYFQVNHLDKICNILVKAEEMI